jgi:hypothetical protein
MQYLKTFKKPQDFHKFARIAEGMKPHVEEPMIKNIFCASIAILSHFREFYD